MKIIILLLIMFSGIAHAESRFTRDADIVSDSFTNLQWQDNLTTNRYHWEAAITRCETLTLGGYDNWRLPNLHELKSLITYEITPAYPKIFRTIDGSESINVYWSSTADNYFKYGAMAVGFKMGSVYGLAKEYSDTDRDDQYEMCMCVRNNE